MYPIVPTVVKKFHHNRHIDHNILSDTFHKLPNLQF